MMLRSRLVLLLTLVLGACTAPAQDPAPPPEAAPDETINLDSEDVVLASSLQPFAACDDLLAYFKREALKIVGPYGLPGVHGLGMPAGRMFSRLAVPGPVVDAAASGSGAGAGGDSAAVPAPQAPQEGVDYSGTNVQEAGVDEPDIVKTDGEVLVTTSRRRLQIIDLDRPEEVAGTLRLPGWEHELLLDGDRVLAMTHADPYARFVPESMRASSGPGGWYGGISVLTLIDISDRSDPQVEAQLTLDGSYRSARMTDGVARVVLSSQPTGLPFTHPKAGGLRAEREATRENRRVIKDSKIEDWLPYYVLEQGDAGDDDATEGTALQCDAVSHPPVFSGLGMVSVLSIDLGGDLAPRGATSVVASGETVYASPDTLYVSTNRWMDPADVAEVRDRSSEEFTTEIHAFDITQPTTAEYVASGSVRGHLLNQFAMSEHEGHLRVATTLGSPWAAPEDSPDASESFVTVLREDGGVLQRVGRVGGLGRGERIYAVRFLGDLGYVVTFRETDPLYTVDLSDPTAPRTTGELKIRGYSAYLHPVGDDLLLGVGQDATTRGRQLGTQISLFDVSDPAAPDRVARTTLRGSSSEVEWDHRAFLYWAPSRLAVIPVERYGERLRAGVRAFTVRPRGIDDAGALRHPARGPRGELGPRIRRSMVVDGRLLTLSEDGVMLSDLDTLEQVTFTRFAR